MNKNRKIDNSQPIVDTILIEANRLYASYDELNGRTLGNEKNASWINSINGVTINKGDKISVESCMINSIGGDNDEVELNGKNLNGIFDNDISIDFNYYVTNRQQNNLNLPKKDHLIITNPYQVDYGAPDFTTFKHFLRNYYYECIEGLFYNLDSTTGTTDVWKPINYQSLYPDVTTSGFFFNQWKTENITNAPKSLIQSNNTKLYVGLEKFEGFYKNNLNSGLPTTPAKFNVFKLEDKTRISLPTSFNTPSSISEYFNDAFKDARRISNQGIIEGTMKPQLIYPKITMFDERKDINWQDNQKIYKHHASSVHGTIQQPNFTNKTMLSFPTITGRLVYGNLDGSWRNKLPWLNGDGDSRIDEYQSGNYFKRDALRQYYKHLLTGDPIKSSSMWYFWFCAGNRAVDKPNVVRTASSFINVGIYTGRQPEAGQPVNDLNTGIYGRQIILFDRLNIANYYNGISYPRKNGTYLKYNETVLNPPAPFASVPIDTFAQTGIYKSPILNAVDVTFPVVLKTEKYLVIPLNIFYNRINLKNIQQYIELNKEPLKNGDNIYRLNFGSSDDSNSCGINNMIANLSTPFQYFISDVKKERYAEVPVMKDGTTVEGINSYQEYFDSSPTQETYVDDKRTFVDSVDSVEKVIQSFRYMNPDTFQGAKDNNLGFMADYDKDQDYLKYDSRLSSKTLGKYKLSDDSVFSFTDSNGSFTNEFLTPSQRKFRSTHKTSPLNYEDTENPAFYNETFKTVYGSPIIPLFIDQTKKSNQFTGDLFWKEDMATIGDMPFMGLIVAQKTISTEAEELEANSVDSNGDIYPNFIPYPLFGEALAPSRSLYDGEYAQIATTEKISLAKRYADEDGGDPNTELYCSSQYNMNGEYVPDEGDGITGDGSSTATVAYKPYIYIGASNPLFSFDSNSSRFGFQSLHTPIRSGNKVYPWYQNKPPEEGVITPFPVVNSGSDIVVNRFNEFETAFSRLTPYNDPENDGIEYRIFNDGYYTSSDDIDISFENQVGHVVVNGTNGNQRSQEGVCIDTLSGVSIGQIWVKQNDTDIVITENNINEMYQYSLWRKLGFEYNQLIPKYGKNNNIFNRSSYNQFINGNNYDQYVNMVKPFTTNNYLSSTINISGNRMPNNEDGFLMDGITQNFSNNTISTSGSSDIMGGLYLPQKLAYSYLLLFSDIVDNAIFYSGNTESLNNKKLIGTISRNYQNGNYFYSFNNGISYTSDRNKSISFINTEIRQPDGRIAFNLDNSSSIIYKIERLRQEAYLPPPF